MNGQLFTQEFLREGIKTTSVWEKLSDEELNQFVARLSEIFAPYRADSKINEAATEQEIILKVLAALGWEGLSLPQNKASATRREDVPDHLLFSDEKSKSAALKEKKDDRRYRHGIAIVEAKRWMRPLDRGDATDKLDPGTPSNQILRYLSASETASDRRVRWGILTNGRHWRLYWQGARSRSEEFFELDIAALVGVKGITLDFEDPDPSYGLKLFLSLFRLAAFLPQSWDSKSRSFHGYALDEARHYEEKVSQDLGERVFKFVFPDLANALAAHDPAAPRPYSREYLEHVREAALIALYRLLFVLYAEDRLLLPIRDKRYLEYSLRRLREEIRDRSDDRSAFSGTATRYWDALKSLFASIATGDAGIGLPAYNGGLFENHRVAILDRTRIPDAKMAPILDQLSRRTEDVLHHWINYRDLSVQHLGSIYERLLEYRLEDNGTALIAQPTSFARKTSGSFYTHEDLVQLILNETIGPLIAQKREAFEKQIAAWRSRRELKPPNWQTLDGLDPASGILDLRVCDPAMGSGHFLVSLVDYAADTVLEATDDSAHLVAMQSWAKNISNPWRSPLVTRIDDIRNRILASARDQGWNVDIGQLDDRHIVRRMILKRIVHGVDKNPMAVELAKLALWLHTFTVGAPLSFLDHHLRCGDSLQGEWPETVAIGLGKVGVSFLAGELTLVEGAKNAINTIADLTDIDVAEAHLSKKLLDDILAQLAPLQASLDLWRAMRWLVPGWPEKRMLAKSEWAEGLAELLSGRVDWRTWSSQQNVDAGLRALLDRAAVLVKRERFLHWPLAFPHVWSGSRQAGFDAFIGNPPWDRMKLQEIEWFAERRPEIAKATRAADRNRMIEALKRDRDPLYADYVEASQAAEAAARVARESGDYPLLSGGDVNLYSLFVERAQALVHTNGVVGLLTPSGIAADKGAAEFFRSISVTGRLRVLYDFENKKVFFPDIHASFKFCVLVFGGQAQLFSAARCAFYLHAVAELDDRNRVLDLSAQDFEAVNPNTGGAPIFRTKRDAEITTAIYRGQPVFIDRRPERDGKPPKKVWPVRYVTMFHMTNDSNLFLRRDELEQQGWYPVEGNRYKRGDEIALPLYEGKMVQMYDHRAANVVVDVSNVHRPAQPAATTLGHHQDPKFTPQPQFWAAKSEVDDVYGGAWAVAFKEITAPTNERSMIACIVPGAGFGNKIPLWIPDEGAEQRYIEMAPLLVSNLNSIVFDFVVRQKLQGQTLNLFIVEQFPLISPEQFEAKLGKQKIADFVRGEVLRLSYTADDLAPFARDLGYDGPPFKWDENDRRHRLARLDALFFQLYGISRDDAAYILDTFPIVHEQDEKAFQRYLTKDLILAYMNAVAAGDLATVVTV